MQMVRTDNFGGERGIGIIQPTFSMYLLYYLFTKEHRKSARLTLNTQTAQVKSIGEPVWGWYYCPGPWHDVSLVAVAELCKNRMGQEDNMAAKNVSRVQHAEISERGYPAIRWRPNTDNVMLDVECK